MPKVIPGQDHGGKNSHTQDVAGELRQGDLITAVAGDSFTYTDSWIFKTDNGETGFAGALAQALPDELCLLRVFRLSGSALAENDLTVTAGELADCGAAGV